MNIMTAVIIGMIIGLVILGITDAIENKLNK